MTMYLSYIAQNPGCSYADVDRAFSRRRNGTIVSVRRLQKKGLVECGAPRPSSFGKGAIGLYVTLECLASASSSFFSDVPVSV